MGATSSTPSSGSASLGSLPPDALALVATHLDPTSRALLARTSKSVRAAILAAGLDVAREFDPKHFAKSPSMLRWARANGGFRSEEETFAAAAFRGDWETLKFLVKDRCRWDSRTCREAARGGHADVLKWARSEGCGVVDEETFAAAAESGDWPTLRFLRAEGYRWDAETCAAAAQHGHLDVLRWARENGCEWSKKTCEHAAGHGHLEILKYAATNGCEFDDITCMCAAGYGDLETLKWAHEWGIPWSKYACNAAASFGHLEILKYLVENGCPWGPGTAKCAADDGHLHVLRWLAENDPDGRAKGFEHLLG